jgi:hypothetical protein
MVDLFKTKLDRLELGAMVRDAMMAQGYSKALAMAVSTKLERRGRVALVAALEELEFRASQVA